MNFLEIKAAFLKPRPFKTTAMLNVCLSGGITRRWSLMGAWVLSLWTLGVHAADPNVVLDQWFAAQTNLRSWSADFTQTRALKALTQPLVTQGHLSFAMPKSFRWELGRPAKTIAMRHDDEMYVVYPLLKRAEHYPMGTNAPSEWRDMTSLLDAGFPKNRAAFAAAFRLVSSSETNGTWLLVLQPRSLFAQKMLKELRVNLHTNDFSLRSHEMIFIDGSSMRNDFTNAVWNPSLEQSLFSWKPDPHFKVLEPLGK
ncbi:MAG: outer membrane lipoprotein carrier protein LolA [Verrucomicrobia bacterium]|nr:outer membrane lipoprotein carrier protein LolA [Verrucomicrobiota bacterium]